MESAVRKPVKPYPDYALTPHVKEFAIVLEP